MEIQLKMQEIVDRLYEDCFEAHRGAFWWDEKRRLAVAFGNDGYRTGRRAQLEVEGLRQWLASRGGEERGFAVNDPERPDGGYSWALACRLPEGLGLDEVEEALWALWTDLSFRQAEAEGRELLPDEGAAWALSQAFTACQAKIAQAMLERDGLI